MNYIVFGNVEKICEHLEKVGLNHGGDCNITGDACGVSIFCTLYWLSSPHICVVNIEAGYKPITYEKMVDLFPLSKPEKMIEVKGKKYSEDTLDEAMKQYVNK